ncbi:hypothetical protein PRNP1_007728 [Phytophthora ramorum]
MLVSRAVTDQAIALTTAANRPGADDLIPQFARKNKLPASPLNLPPTSTMVSISASFAFVVAAIGVAYGYIEAEAEAALAEAAALSKGEYYRPPTYLTSGAVNSTAPFRRSPCPAMNTLANHGYLPRDGKNITVDQALAVVMDKFNIAEDLAAVMGGLSPDLFDMNDLSKHNDQVEHDASLVRIDSYFGVDPYLVSSTTS